MKIAYLAHNLASNLVQGGVGIKINSQIRFWKDAGNTVELFLHTPESKKSSRLNAGHIYFYENKGNGVLDTLFYEVAKAQALHRLIRDLTDFAPDLIYFRYGLYIYSLHRIFEIAPVVAELNSNDHTEYRHKSYLRYLYNLFSRKILLRRVKGLVCISKEIANLPENLRFGKPSVAVPNGIDMHGLVQFPAPANPKPRLFFTGTPGNVWHGIDKIIWFARQYPDLQFDIVGSSESELKHFDPPENLQAHGFVPFEQYKDILSRADVAIGSLALHRNDMKEGSPLKVREYLAFGIPTIIGYQDGAFDSLDTNEMNTIFMMPSEEDNVRNHAPQLHDFVYAMLGKRISRDLMLKHIDIKVTEELRLSFMEQILSKSLS